MLRKTLAFSPLGVFIRPLSQCDIVVLSISGFCTFLLPVLYLFLKAGEGSIWDVAAAFGDTGMLSLIAATLVFGLLGTRPFCFLFGREGWKGYRYSLLGILGAIFVSVCLFIWFVLTLSYLGLVKFKLIGGAAAFLVFPLWVEVVVFAVLAKYWYFGIISWLTIHMIARQARRNQRRKIKARGAYLA